MSSNRAWSTSRSSATEQAGSGRATVVTLPVCLLALLVLAAQLATAEAAAKPPAASKAAAKPPAASKKKGPLLTFVSEARGERMVEVFDLHFACFETRYRHTRAPKSENPTGERIEVIQKRKECSCVRLADWSKIKMPRIRQIDITYPVGERVARVRVTKRDGTSREYPATDLYGGVGIFPPRFVATVEGEHREFPLILPDTPGAAWPEERLVRMLVYRSGYTSASH